MEKSLDINYKNKNYLFFIIVFYLFDDIEEFITNQEIQLQFSKKVIGITKSAINKNPMIKIASNFPNLLHSNSSLLRIG
ncbi:hypothetical protein C1646_753478 [Rhizophagus diaphanus]|nr:hypothetical protein C1646_753478 [Rhizophagus diaphanus] [Rhizophagus sp. MUCL 43196]